MMKKLLIAALAALISTAALGQQIGSGEVMGNSRAQQGTPRGETVTAILDRAFSAVNGTVLCRAAGAWNDCSALTLGIAGSTIGTLGFAGNTSGTATITPQAAAGTPTLTLPTATGTFAVGASAPLALDAGTGMLTCATCFTTTSAAALTRTNDTNVTLTLGGAPNTALVNAASITVGWSGTLSLTRGGSAKALTASNGGIVWTDADSMEVLSGTATARQMLQSGSSATPAWSTATWPATTTANRVLYSSANNVVGEITSANRGVLNTDGSGVPSITPTPTLGVNGGTGGQITLSGSTSGSAAIRVPAAAGTGTVFQLPGDNGTSGFALTTNGSGVTSWAAVGGTGTVTEYRNTGSNGITTTGNCTVTTNNTASPCNIELTSARRTLPTSQAFLSGSGTYTTPANVLWIEILMIGGGAGGAGSGSGPGGSGNGGDTCWNTSGAACTSPVYSAGGGTGGVQGSTGAGGTVTGSGTCMFPVTGGTGGPANATVNAIGGMGGMSTLGGASSSFSVGTSSGTNAVANTGGGGSGGTSGGAVAGGGGGGGAGATCRTIINSPAASYTYVVGTGGAGGAAGASGSPGGNGAAGRILVIEHYNS